MIIDSVADFIASCPLIETTPNANFLGEKIAGYSIDNVSANPIVKKYVDGGSLRQFVFVLASRELYGKEAATNFENSVLYEKFADWLEAQNAAGNLPTLGDGLRAVKIEAMTGGYVYDGGAGSARYQIQCRLIYEKRSV